MRMQYHALVDVREHAHKRTHFFCAASAFSLTSDEDRQSVIPMPPKPVVDSPCTVRCYDAIVRDTEPKTVLITAALYVLSSSRFVGKDAAGA